MRFHINGEGNTGKCEAEPGNCPITRETGGEHYESESDALQAYSNTQETFGTNKRTITNAVPSIKQSEIDEIPETGAIAGERQWRAKGGEFQEDYLRDTEAAKYGLDPAKYLDMCDISYGITLPRNDQEAREYLKFVNQEAKWQGMTQEQHKEQQENTKRYAEMCVSHLADEPGSPSWRKKTIQIRAFRQAVSQYVRSLSTNEFPSDEKDARAHIGRFDAENYRKTLTIIEQGKLWRRYGYTPITTSLRAQEGDFLHYVKKSRNTMQETFITFKNGKWSTKDGKKVSEGAISRAIKKSQRYCDTHAVRCYTTLPI